MEFEGDKKCQSNAKTRPKKYRTGKLRPKNHLSQNSPHGGASDEVGAAVLGLVLVHALLGLGGFGLGGHLVFDAVLVRHGDLSFVPETGGESEAETERNTRGVPAKTIMVASHDESTWRRTDPFCCRFWPHFSTCLVEVDDAPEATATCWQQPHEETQQRPSIAGSTAELNSMCS